MFYVDKFWETKYLWPILNTLWQPIEKDAACLALEQKNTQHTGICWLLVKYSLGHCDVWTIFGNKILWVIFKMFVIVLWSGHFGVLWNIPKQSKHFWWFQFCTCAVLYQVKFHINISTKFLWTSKHIIFHHVGIPIFAIASTNVQNRTSWNSGALAYTELYQ